jgi:hypothetical protein
MWLYLDELRFKFEFCSGRMIIGWDMALALVFFVQILSCPNFFFDVLWDIDLIFGMWLYRDELQFKFEFRSGRMIFGWVMSFELVFFVQILSCPDFLFYVLWDIDLIFGMWLYLDDLHFKFKLWPLNLYVLFKLLVFLTCFWRLMRYWFDIWYIL